MDKISDSGSEDAGSIPAACTFGEPYFHLFGFCLTPLQNKFSFCKGYLYKNMNHSVKSAPFCASAFVLEAVRLVEGARLSDQLFDVWVEQGVITGLYPTQSRPITADFACPLPAPAKREAEICLSVAWLDMRAWVGEMGYEYKETLAQAEQAALRGGFLQVAILPNQNPILENKETIAFFKNRKIVENSAVEWLPIAALTAQCQGKDLTEFHDLQAAGAVAFSDGLKAVQHTGTLLRALQYARPLGAVLMQICKEPHLSERGQMHEGVASTRLGLRGLPALAEAMAIEQMLALLRYTGGRLHFSTLSTAQGVDLVRKAKAEGLAVTADMASYQLSFLDEDLVDFDTNLKVYPPFRTQTDRLALIAALEEGTIDFVVSNHQPQDIESKRLEFDLADFGMTNLQTAFSSLYAALLPVLGKEKSLPLIVEKFTTAPRRCFGLEEKTIEVGQKAFFTLFAPDAAHDFEQNPLQKNASKALNSPFLDPTIAAQKLKGRVLGVIEGEKCYLF